MKLSRTERWILANQYRILAALDPARAARYEDCVLALEKGYAKVIDRMAAHVSRDDTDHKESEEVDEILTMFDSLQRAYRVLEDPYGIDPARLRFPGFDAKTEADYLGYAQFLLERERWPERLDAARPLDARTPMLRTYRRMLDEWKRRARDGEISQRDIGAIVDAAKGK
jgi:uncharacterized protein YfbU (UPF0304 family)